MNTNIYQDEIDDWKRVWREYKKRSSSNYPGSSEAFSNFIDMVEHAFPRLIAEVERLQGNRQ